MNHKKPNSKEVFNNIINVLKDLYKKYPDMDVCRHISDATAEFPSIWGVNNKEFLYQIEKYKVELDNNLPSEREVEQLYKDSLDIEHILYEEEDL